MTFGQSSIVVSIVTRSLSFPMKSISGSRRSIMTLSSLCNTTTTHQQSSHGRRIIWVMSPESLARRTQTTEALLTHTSTSTNSAQPNQNPVSFRTYPSPLSSLPDGFRPGQAQQLLQVKGADKAMLRRTEVRDMFLAARGGYPKDAKCILHTLKVIRRCNEHYIKDWQAQAALQGMLRAWTPIQRINDGDKCAAWTLPDASDSNSDYCNARLKAAIFVYEAILDDTTGLITSVSMFDIEELLFKDTVLKALLANPQHLDNTIKQEALKLTKRVFHKLILRASNPERLLSKKQAAKYRKKVWTKSPPSPQTAHLATQICLLLGGKSPDAQIAILGEFFRMSGDGAPIPEETLTLVNAAREREEEQLQEALRLVNEAREREEELQNLAAAANDNNDETTCPEQESLAPADLESDNDKLEVDDNTTKQT